MRGRNRPGRSLQLRISVVALVCSLVIPSAAAASTENATTVTVSSDGTLVYAGFDGAGFSVFSRDSSTGQLTVLGDAATTASGGGLSDPAIVSTPDGANVYGVDGQTNALLQYAPSTAGVVQQQTYPVLSDPTIAKDPITLATSPDGSSIYVLTYGVQFGTGIGVTSDGKISAFERDPTTGDLTLVGTTQLNADGAVGIDPIVSPDGKFVYVGGIFSGGVAVLSRDPATGAVTVLGDDGNLNASTAIAISPDDNFVYEAGPPSSSSSASSAISVLMRDSSTGRLTPVSQINNGAAGVADLSDISGLAVSPDGQCLYATSRADSSLGYFTRNAATGGLTFDGAVVEGTGGVTGLADARDVAVSDDGKNVYVASPGDGGVAVFTRNPTTCVPTFVQLAQDLFTIAPPTVDQKDGTATLPVDVDTSGTLASSVQPLASKDSARPATDGARLISVTGPTTVDLPISLSGQSQEELDKHHKLSVNVAVTFTATGGAPTTKTATVELVTAAPAVSKLRVSPRKFSLAGRLVKRRCVEATSRNAADVGCRRPISLRVSYRLNVAADVLLMLKRQRAGGHGARFVDQRGKITLTGRAGTNQFIFKGRIGGHVLRSGTYQLIAMPTGGRATKVTFQILP